MRPVLLVILLASFSLCSPRLHGQEASEIDRLFNKLQDPDASESAAQQLKKLAEKRPVTRRDLAQRLPGVIERHSQGPVWLNAVRLAGEFKIAEAAPAISNSLRGESTGGAVSFAEYLRLDDDPAGKALALIGEPSIGPVRKVLEDSNPAARQRAALVLININSTESKQVLRSHLQRENDPQTKAFIEQRLDVMAGH